MAEAGDRCFRWSRFAHLVGKQNQCRSILHVSIAAHRCKIVDALRSGMAMQLAIDAIILLIVEIMVLHPSIPRVNVLQSSPIG